MLNRFVALRVCIVTAIASFSMPVWGQKVFGDHYYAKSNNKSEAQKEVEQLATQMQAGAYDTVEICKSTGKPPVNLPSDQISSIEELRDLLLTGQYQLFVVVTKTSRPKGFSRCGSEGIRYFPLVSRSNVKIPVKMSYAYGRSFFQTGSSTKNTVTQDDGSQVTYTNTPGYSGGDIGKPKYVKANYVGVATAYLTLGELKGVNWWASFQNVQKSCDYERREAARRQKKDKKKFFQWILFHPLPAPCLRFYPQDVDHLISIHKLRAERAIDEAIGKSEPF